jgi:hypothetical protein
LAQNVEVGGKTFSVSYRSFSFSETLITIELGTALRTEINGDFHHSEDGQLSGTITGARTVYQTSELITTGDQQVIVAPPRDLGRDHRGERFNSSPRTKRRFV